MCCDVTEPFYSNLIGVICYPQVSAVNKQEGLISQPWLCFGQTVQHVPSTVAEYQGTLWPCFWVQYFI